MNIFLFLEALKTAYRRLKIDTIIKISVWDCLNFLKNTQKKLTKKINEDLFQQMSKFERNITLDFFYKQLVYKQLYSIL